MVQRALSSSSTHSKQKLFTIQKENTKKTQFFAGSASSLNSTSNDSQYSSEHHAYHQHHHHHQQNKPALNAPPKLESKACQAPKTLSQELAEELDVTKEILIKYNVPINRKIIKILREYICQYGSVQAFKAAIESAEEKNKLNAFVASSCAAIYNTSVSQPSLASVNTFQRFSEVSPYVGSKSATPLATHLTPTYPYPSGGQSKIITNLKVFNQRSSFQDMTPITPSLVTTTAANATKYSQIQLDKTPTKATHSAFVRSNLNRIQTPSPLRHAIQHRSSVLSDAMESADAHAPPKPPRRSSSRLTTNT